MERAGVNHARALSVGVAVVLAAILLYFSLRGIEWRQVGRVVAGASAWRLLAVVTIATVTVFLRACRWRVLLNAAGDVSVPSVFWATTAGYFGNNFLPARAGELVRTLMISSRSRLDTSYVLATALAERVADAVVLVSIAAVVLLTLPAPPGWLASAIRPFAALALIGAGGIALLPLMGGYASNLIARMPMPQRLRPKLSAVADSALHGLRAFHHVRRLAAFATLTAIIWTLDAAGVVVGASALGLDIPLHLAFLLLAGLGLGSALPSTPGYVGIYQFVAVSVLTPFGFSRNDAIAYILVAQALNYVVIGFWGSLGIVRYRRVRASM